MLYQPHQYKVVNNMEMTFAMIKPNGVKSGLVGKIIERYEDAGLAVCAVKCIK